MNNRVSKVFKDHSTVYMYQSDEGRALFSLLSLKDYRVAEKISTEFSSLIPDVEEEIWDTCVIEHSFGSDILKLKAGLVTTVAQVIIRLSAPNGLLDLEAGIEDARSQLNDIREQLVLKVCEAFPAYNPASVEDLDWPTLAKRVAQAEKILGATIEFNTQPELLETESSLPTKTVDGVEYINTDMLNREMAEA